MRISIIGSGYVGVVTGIGFSELGHNITFIDIDNEKIKKLNDGVPPIYEKGLKELMARNKTKNRFHATKNYEEILKTDITFICVSTPSKDDGSIDLKYIKDVSSSLGDVLRAKDYHTVVVKSTVVPGTTEDVVKPIIEKSSGKKSSKGFGLAMNPEFLKEGVAVEDFFKPDRIVIGVSDDDTKKTLSEIYSEFDCPKMFTGIKTAEMIKYVSNSFLATKISFANEIGNLCKELGIDSYEVFKGVGLDDRINPKFFRSGIGFGGSCFPKDVKALISQFEEKGLEANILKSVVKVNDIQPLRMVELLKKHLEIKGKKIGVLGLSFKPDTDDIREARATILIRMLIEEGAEVIVYDPQGMDNFKKTYPDLKIRYVPSKEVLNSDAVLIVTEWPEFEELNYTGKLVIDGRKNEKAKKEAEVYEGICW